jgi:hypothetical protein
MAPKVAEKVGIENVTLLNPRKNERFLNRERWIVCRKFGEGKNNV